ncbi:lipopolysaccharide biosynthesis protein, partial [Candidatus Latescibacterota bacterium]
VLARLLTPEDFGLIAMVAAVTGFVMMFKDMGLSMATVQRAEINHGQISTLFWINVALSLAIMLLTATLAPAIAWFYSEPRLIWITLALAGAFIFSGFTVQHQALLRRQMNFGRLAAIEITSMLVGVITAIVSALYGAGYWALVLMQLSTAIVGAITVWMVCGWRPGLPVRRSGVREMLTFGGHLTGFSFVNYFARNTDKLLIGKFWGAGPLGLYSKAYGLLMLPLSQINAPLSAVAIPALSRLQDEPERYRNYYLKAISLIAFFTMPMAMFMIVMSGELIQIVLGPQWSEASRIFLFLGIAALVQPIANTSGWLFISQGRARDMLRWGLIGGTLAIVSIIAGLPWGTVGVAGSYAITGLFIRTPLLFLFVGCKGPLRNGDFYRVLVTPAVFTLIVLAALFVFRRYTSVHNPLTNLAFALSITTIACFLLLCILPTRWCT